MVNFPGKEVAYTRIAEYKHWPIQDDLDAVKRSPWTRIVREYSTDKGDPYYPVPNPRNQKLYREYQQLADKEEKRVVVVDTSNEIAGDGDIPHPAIGSARRMQVRNTELQHDVMIEAVENHMPEVIVIDEISTEKEANACRTIAERGVQLIATAHGNTLDNLIINPTISDLVGGTKSVTLGDIEARRRKSQKTVLERQHEPTFDIVVEIIEKYFKLRS